MIWQDYKLAVNILVLIWRKFINSFVNLEKKEVITGTGKEMLNLNKEISNTADIALCLKSLFVNLYKKAAAKSYSGTVSLLINNNMSTINTDSFIESDFTEENFQQP